MLIDTTLREGAQMFGAYFNKETKLKIIFGLLSLGVDEIEMGWVGQEGLEELVDRIRPLAKNTALSVWSPCRGEDISKAAALNVDRVNIGVPVSDLHVEKRLGIGREGLLERLAHTVLTAGLLGIEYISVGLEDVSRADEQFALVAGQLAESMGASRIRLADSVGVLTPMKMKELVHIFRNQIDIDVAVHCHDDFGMGTGNAITALQCGADYADGSILGIGERSGISATEELATYLTMKETNPAYQTERIRELCHFVSVAAGVQIPRTKAVAGQDIFACESGIHVHAMGKSPNLFEPYDPARINANRVLAVGGKSGRAAIAHALGKNNIEIPKNEIATLVAEVKRLSWELERPLTKQELSELSKTN
nr:pyruvate carboxyltransferase [uncultured Pseudodesulfovibrio sp.]